MSIRQMGKYRIDWDNIVYNDPQTLKEWNKWEEVFGAAKHIEPELYANLVKRCNMSRCL